MVFFILDNIYFTISYGPCTGPLADWATFFLHRLQRTWASLPLCHQFDIQGLLSSTKILGSPINSVFEDLPKFSVILQSLCVVSHAGWTSGTFLICRWDHARRLKTELAYGMLLADAGLLLFDSSGTCTDSCGRWLGLMAKYQRASLDWLLVI